MTPRTENLLNRWIDGELSAPEAEAVQRMLAEDPEVRRLCYELLMVDRLLDKKIKGRWEEPGVIESLARDPEAKRGLPLRRIGIVLAMAAAIALLFGGHFFRTGGNGATPPFPRIAGSVDSRITIAQRQNASQWAIGELLRLERGTADVRLANHVSAYFEGPAAIELLDDRGGVRLREGIASIEVEPGNGAAEVEVGGGVLRTLGARYIVEVLPDGVANIRLDSGFLEIRPREAADPLYLKEGDSLRLEPDGTNRPIRLPEHHFRSELPKQVLLFRDQFKVAHKTPLAGHLPATGGSWEILSEANPTLIRNQRLDTSSGARRIVGNLRSHGDQGSRAVYIFSFDLQPPEWIHDKANRLGGIEYITIRDGGGNNIVSIVARAANGHRWQLADERTKATTALTPVCALWTHSLTLCYGLDGLVTLHDGPTAQAPIIAELRVADPPPAAAFLIGNFDGGDLALSRVETLLLPAPPAGGL